MTTRIFKKKRSHLEQHFQSALVRDLRKILPGDCVMVAFPAGGGGVIRGKILKASGLEPGVPDLLFFYRSCTRAMELKTKVGRVSKAQRAMHARLLGAGVLVETVRTLDEALDALRSWDIPLRV